VARSNLHFFRICRILETMLAFHIVPINRRMNPKYVKTMVKSQPTSERQVMFSKLQSDRYSEDPGQGPAAQIFRSWRQWRVGSAIIKMRARMHTYKGPKRLK